MRLSPIKIASLILLASVSAPALSQETANATSDDGHVMGFRHATLPIHGVQFHPESIATEHGHAMLANFMALAGMRVKERA